MTNSTFLDFKHNRQLGFTLVELMIALVLGLLISAAAFQVFYLSLRSSTMQTSATEVQDSAIFGLEQIETQIKFANLGAETHKLNGSTRQGGIVINQTNVTDLDDKVYLNETSLYSRQSVGDSQFVNVSSDQLTMQFVAPQTMFNCEGDNINKGDLIVQRYFLSNGNLRCKAVTIDVNDADANKAALSNNGEVVVADVDYFRMVLITDSGYKTINSYVSAGSNEPILGVKLGLVISGNTPVIDSTSDSVALFGTNLTLKEGSGNSVRRAYETTILLRNARY